MDGVFEQTGPTQRLRAVAAAAERLAAAVPPASGSIVMATGIVSIALSIDGEETLSRALAAIALLVWVVLAASFVAVGIRRPRLALSHARSTGAFTAIAGTNVLGARAADLGWNDAAAALLAIAFALWLLVVPYALAHWRRPTTGGSFVLAVATESLAVLAAELSIHDGASWLALGAVVLLGLGLCFYVFVVATFDLGQLLHGRGEQWVSGGALAIATLACAGAAQAAAAFQSLRGAAPDLDVTSLALWAAAVAWLPALLLGELAAREAAWADLRRWSTVFPLGMYAACSFAVSAVEGPGGLGSFARVWVWIAFAVWLPVLGGMLRRAAEVARERVRHPV